MKSRRVKDGKKLRPEKELYFALDTLDLSFFQCEIEEISQLWDEGYHIADIADCTDREVEEVAVLIMDLARKNKVEKREGGVFGN